MIGIRDLIVLTVILGSIPVCFLRPFYGVLLWTVFSFVNPQQLSFGIARVFPVALWIAIPTIAGALVFTRTWQSLKSREFFLLLALWLWFTITSLATAFTPAFADHVTDTWFEWKFVSKILVMTVVAMGVINTWSRLRWLMLAIALSFGFFVVKAIPWMASTGGQYRLYGPGSTMIGDNNDFGLALNMTLPLFFYLARTEPDRRVRYLMRFLFLVTIPAIFLTYSRGALVGLLVVVFLMLMRMRRRNALIPILALAAVLAVFFMPEKWQERMDFSRDGALLDTSAKSRINSWTYAYRLALDYPVMGGGFQAFTPALFNRYAPNPRDVHGPHSVYFGVLAEHGFVGLFLYLSLVVSLLVTLQRIRRSAGGVGEEQATSYATMLQLSLAGFLASGAFLGRAYFDYYFTIVACAIVLKRLWRTEVAEMEYEEQTEEMQEA